MTDRLTDAERQASQLSDPMTATAAERQAVQPASSHEVAAPEHGPQPEPEPHGAHDQLVYAPDQLHAFKHAKGLKIGGVLTAIALVIMVFGPGHEGNISKIYLVGFAAFILFLIVMDRVLRRRGLRR
ncbi:MAG TPA: DUF2631 domain-containing protein [Micromonosporaceae bacterium]|jgi:hypothetical protein